jgi:hypothetical protein
VVMVSREKRQGNTRVTREVSPPSIVTVAVEDIDLSIALSIASIKPMMLMQPQGLSSCTCFANSRRCSGVCRELQSPKHFPLSSLPIASRNCLKKPFRSFSW